MFFADGFKTALTNEHLAYFDPALEFNFCRSCQGMITLIKNNPDLDFSMILLLPHPNP